MKLLALVLTFVPLAALHGTELQFAGIFTDHAVLQRDEAVPVWGWADPDEQVVVTFAGQTKTATADADGAWLVRLDPIKACTEGRTLAAHSAIPRRTAAIHDVVVGDVWLCSGQSNMGISMSVPGNPVLAESATKADNPRLRLFATSHQFPDAPARDTQGRWTTATPEAVKTWIAIGYLFGDRIQRAEGVPVGIVVSCMGGTSIESWLPQEVLLANPANRAFLDKHAKAVEQLPTAVMQYEKELSEFKKRGTPREREPRRPDGMPNSARNPAACYNGKIAPILPYGIKGVLWYQGEANVWGFTAYPSQMADLMRAWRTGFGLPRLPFLMSELAPYGPPSSQPQDSAHARFGEALAQTAKTDGTAWVITIVDGGDPLDIHPVKKEIPAARFAAMALAKVYGKPGVSHGPKLESWQAADGKAVLKFSDVGSGLVAKAVNLGGHGIAADRLQGFELAGDDRTFFRAEARIEDGNTVAVTSADVPKPVAVRYAWAAFPLCNLFNAEGFPAYPLRTDDWPWQPPSDAAHGTPTRAVAPPSTPVPERGEKAVTTRIAIRDGSFVDASTGKPFHPFGVNYFRGGRTAEHKRGHAAFSPGSYDEAFVSRMIEDLSRQGFNTVRSFLSNHSGAGGIVADSQTATVNPAYLQNLIHFLRIAQAHGIRVILTWDTWPPESKAWAEMPLADEARHGWVTEPPPGLKINGFRLTPKPIRAKANAIRAVIEALHESTPELLPVVLAWELENEIHFNLDQEPFQSRPTAFAFGGREFDLSTDSGVQSLMDAATRAWATSCADAIHVADPKALVSASVFTFAAVGRQGPGTSSTDQTKDMRVPARPRVLLQTSIDFVDLHIYASRSAAEHLERVLASVEMPLLGEEARRLGKPILIGESGVAAPYMRRSPVWKTIHHDIGVELLREFHQALAAYPFSGVLHWHYGNPDSTEKDEFPAMWLFPQYGEALRATRETR
jgi:sialate O-acetylesterase